MSAGEWLVVVPLALGGAHLCALIIVIFGPLEGHVKNCPCDLHRRNWDRS